jgi:valyl-tRNA synthetase
LIVRLRSARAEMNIDPKKSLKAALVFKDARTDELIRSNADKVEYMARLSAIEYFDTLPAQRVLLKGLWCSGEFGLDLEGAIDYRVERERLRKEVARTRGEIEQIARKIQSHEFIVRAPESVVNENRARHTDLVERLNKLEANLNQLPRD